MPETERGIKIAMKFAYETLLQLYPAHYRNLFAREMTGVFEQVVREYRLRGPLSYFAFLLMEFGGLIVGAVTIWTDEYMRRTAPRRWLSLPVLVPVIAGVCASIYLQGLVYSGLAGHRPKLLPPPTLPQTNLQLLGLMALIGMCIALVSVLSLAFVWNMRAVGNRSGRLKPIWMPGRAVRGPLSRRDQILQRNARREREMRRVPRRPLGLE